MTVRSDRERWSERLLAAIAGRDGDAFSVFYRRHLAETVAYLVRETRDPELAADLTAEVFSAVLLGARRYRPEREAASHGDRFAGSGSHRRRGRQRRALTPPLGPLNLR
jgi:hypothetical protein